VGYLRYYPREIFVTYIPTYLECVVLNNPRIPYNVLSNIQNFLDNNIINENLLPMGYGANGNVGFVCYNPRC
jgi:hypothetical protein